MKTLKFDFSNMGGICRMYAIPPSCIRRVRKDYMTGLYYVDFRNYDNIIFIPIYADDTFYFNEDQSFDNPGDGYSINIGGVIPKLMFENTSDISILERGQWYVLFADNNGRVKLAGDDEVRLKFLTHKTTGTRAADRNQIAFTFSSIQENPTIDITPDDIDKIY